ncbi:MAG: tryptophan synthase subunit alpha [Bacillus sp. (in: Bacteria)]|nr:tryptophan synthase subunit alpha [Bacillus sp. (in: firmicutes)]
MDVTIDIALALQEAGVDAIEWGVPFSDPLADGPVIQAAGERARKQGTTLMTAIDGVKKARKKGLTLPVVLFTYINPVLAYGEEVVIRKMEDAGIDGILIPDLPFEESDSISERCREKEISLIPLITLSSHSRIEQICARGDGFLYFVSSLGVTGARRTFSETVGQSIATVKEKSSVPVLVGFGISHKEHVQFFNGFADGVIVGSALVALIHENEKALLCENQKESSLTKNKIICQTTNFIIRYTNKIMVIVYVAEWRY